MDVVTLTPNDRSYAVELPYEDMSTPGTTTHTAESQETQKLDTKLFTTRRVSPRLELLSPTIEPFPRSVLIRDVIVDWQEDRPQPRMFFEENGMIGFAPGGTQTGDLISQFKDSEVAVVLRKSPDQDLYQIIGRAANAYPTGPPPGPFRCHKFSGGDMHKQIQERPVLLSLDLSTLQLLSSLPDQSVELYTLGKPFGAKPETTFSAEFMAVPAVEQSSADITPTQAPIDLDILGDGLSASRKPSANKEDGSSGKKDLSSQKPTTKKHFSIKSIYTRLTRRFDGSSTSHHS